MPPIAGRCGTRHSRLLDLLFARLIHAHQNLIPIVRPLVDLQYVFHRAHKLRALTGGMHQLCFSHGFSSFFLSAWRTVSVLMVPTYLTLDQPGQPTASGSNWHAPPAVPRRPSLSTVLHLRRPVSFDADAVAFCDSAQTSTPSSTQRLRIRSTVDCPTPSALVMSASFIPPSERDSSLISRMRAWVCLYAAARPRETKALSSCCSSVVSLIRYFL